jgi:SAM-dependent methyltransferase
MKQYGPATYGDRIAGFYDEHYAALPSDHPMIETLARLAGDGCALELGIGTGRVALPLASRGVLVHGIDASATMVARLRAKPGGDAIPVTIGDFADIAVADRYSLIYAVFNTFFALMSQDDQVRCIASCAAHLDEGGAFLVEAFYPDLTRYARGQNVSAADVGVDHVSLEITRHDPVQQHVSSQHIRLTTNGLEMYPVNLRYAWPTEIDLMARLAGLRLESRSGGWRSEPYTASAGVHVSVYRKLGCAAVLVA